MLSRETSPTRPGREDCLQAGRATMLYRKRVYLNAGLLNGVGLRSQVQYALPDSTGHVQAVNDVLIVVLSLAVCACVNLLFSGVVVDARGRTTGGAGSQTETPEPW